MSSSHFSSPILPRASISRKEAFTHYWYPSFLAAAQGMPSDCLALEVKSTCISGSHGTVITGESVLGRLQHEGHCIESTWKYTLCVSEKEAFFAFSQVLAWRAGSGLVHFQKPMEVVSGNVGLGASSCPLSLSALPQPVGISEKGFHTLVWNPDVCSYFPGDASIAWGNMSYYSLWESHLILNWKIVFYKIVIVR